MKNNWSIQEGESSLEYSNRLNSELNIKEIKKLLILMNSINF